MFNLPLDVAATNTEVKDAIEAAELGYEVELTDTVTSICISKDGRYLLANVSLKQPRLELFDLGTQSGPPGRRGEIVRRYRGGHE